MTIFFFTGAPSEEFLNQPVGASDHPFLRMHGPTLNQIEGGRGQQTDALTEKMANFKLTGTDADMDYYEMRYQQRVSLRRIFKSRFKGLSLKMGRGDEQKPLMHCIMLENRRKV